MPSSLERLLSTLGGRVRRGVESGLLVAWLVLAALMAVLVFRQPNVLRPELLQSLVINGSLALAIAAAGLAVVVIAGGLDLSSAGVIAISNAILTTQLSADTGRNFLVMAIVLGLGVSVGFLNGFLVYRLELEPVVVTIGTGFILGGGALLILPKPTSLLAEAVPAVSWVTSAIGAVPVGFLILLAVGGGWFLLRRSPAGSAIVAVGSDLDSARQQGVLVRMAVPSSYAIAGGLYALAGLVVTSQTQGGDPAIGGGYLLGAFAAVVLGGIAIGGGRGSVIGALIGAFSFTIAVNTLLSLGVASYWTNLARGLLLLAAIGIQSLSVFLLRRVSTGARPMTAEIQE